MASLLKEFRGKTDLIYIDPPFDVPNVYLAHQEKELVDRDAARQAMTDWILGLRRIWRTE